MKPACAIVAFCLSPVSLLMAETASAGPALAACPVTLGEVVNDTTNPPIRFSLLGAEGHDSLQIAKPSEAGFFVAANQGEHREAIVVEFQVDAERETMRIPVAALAESLAWSTAVSGGSALVGTVSRGSYRLVLTYVSPAKPSPGKTQRLCTVMSEAFELAQPFSVHRFE